MVSAQEPLSALPGSHARVWEEEQEPREQRRLCDVRIP